jgi:hypothetical protein
VLFADVHDFAVGLDVFALLVGSEQAEIVGLLLSPLLGLYLLIFLGVFIVLVLGFTALSHQ